MIYKKLFPVFFAFNFQIIEPKVSFIKKAKNFFRDPENKKMILNVATGAICATGVSLIVSYRHELAQLLWGNGNYYVDPFVDPIVIGDYPCKGLEKKYKNISIKQIRVPQQSGAQCGLHALVSAITWLEGNCKNFVSNMHDSNNINNLVNDYLNKNETIKKLNGQWIDEVELLNLYGVIRNDDLIAFVSDKNDLNNNDIRPAPLFNSIKKVLDTDFENQSTHYYSVLMGSMKRNTDKENVLLESCFNQRLVEGYKDNKELMAQNEKIIRNLEPKNGHWYTINIAVNSGSLEIVVTDSLNIDRTHDKAVQMVIDNLVN